jgi:hypothetical protein
MTEEPVVYIDRLYDDPFDRPQPWRRRRRDASDHHEWTTTTGGTAGLNEESGFGTVDEAIAWGRERAEVILVRLGSDLEAIYSAGRRHATENTDGSGWQFPHWPPRDLARLLRPTRTGLGTAGLTLWPQHVDDVA